MMHILKFFHLRVHRFFVNLRLTAEAVSLDSFKLVAANEMAALEMATEFQTFLKFFQVFRLEKYL